MFSCSLPMPFILNISKSGASYPKEFLKYIYCVFSHDVMAAIFVSQTNESVAMFESQTSPVGVELFSYVNAFFCANTFA